MNFLVLDADVAVHQIIITVLRRHSPDAQFSTATSVEKVREIVQGQEFNGVISGLNCDDLNGLQLVAELETIFPGMNILIFCEENEFQSSKTTLEERGHVVVGRDIYSTTLTPILSAYVKFNQQVKARR